MTSDNHAQYLEAMGIQVWQERVSAAELAVAVIAEESETIETSQRGGVEVQECLWVVAETTGKESEALLNNILQAIGQSRQSIHLIPNMAGLSLSDQAVRRPSLILRMGSISHQPDQHQNTPLVVTASLAEMLREPGLKRKAWHKLINIPSLLPA